MSTITSPEPSVASLPRSDVGSLTQCHSSYRPLSWLLVLFTLLLAFGCGGSGGGSESGVTVRLTASRTRILPGESVTLTWTSSKASSVASSNFGATDVSGSTTVGPLDATKGYTITVRGTEGSATATVTVVVTPDMPVNSIPSGVLLYSVTSASGGSTLYYVNPSGGAPVAVGTYAEGVKVFGTNSTENRLVLSKPLGGTSSNVGVYLTDLDGVGSTVRLGTGSFTQIRDASIAATGNVLVATPSDYVSYTSAGAKLASYENVTPVSGGVNSAGTALAAVNRGGDTLSVATFPNFGGWTDIRSHGAFSWVRWSPASNTLVYSQSGTIRTINADGSGDQKIIDSSSYPTFDATGTRVFFSRVGDGIYVKNLESGTETRVVAISGAWDGRIVWH